MTTEDIAHKTAFQYGSCKTDKKDGSSLRADFRDIDYFFDEPYTARVATMLEQMGLPQPEPEQIFRGTHHDMLFLDSHGVVLRIGPTDVEDLMNPAIVQPLGWIEDEEIAVPIDNIYHNRGHAPLTVAIYPGIEHYNTFFTKADRPALVGDVEDFLKETGQGAADVNVYNMGIARVLDDTGEEVAVPLLLDADNEWNFSDKTLNDKRQNLITSLKEKTRNKGEIMSYVLQDIFKDAQDTKLFQRAFQQHQPLRNLFWRAFQDVTAMNDTPKQDHLEAFWQKCADITNAPQQAKTHQWTSRIDHKGQQVFKRVEIPVPNLVLQRPWTGQPQDQYVAPIHVPDSLKTALKHAHGIHFQEKPQTSQQATKKTRRPIIDFDFLERLQNTFR